MRFEALLGSAALLMCLLNVEAAFQCPADKPEKVAPCGDADNDLPCLPDGQGQCIDSPDVKNDKDANPGSTGYCCRQPATPPPAIIEETTTAAPITAAPTLPSLPSFAPVTQSTTQRPAPRPSVRPPAKKRCVDLGPDCITKSYLCHNSLYTELMKWQCPRTCGFCSSTGQQPNGGRPGGYVRPKNGRKGCRDLGPDCTHKAYLCNNHLYYQLMTVQCPMTCRRC
ncbi:hypothetical protein QR680_011353 [Steinernema hermaphroditum]|uniref:ShKT domain-containing protein n=1 Tax=Steinernema hermaphroditum TaxID=289476 RepID=A0AA39IUT2_9BILA|nr:hypothetical protein QR680_011353 [Steinernema hermaphroditum]